MGIRFIHGFLHEQQEAIPEWGSMSVKEVCLVETDDPSDNIIDLLSSLPAAPNTITPTNPKGISFTFDVSLHPDSSVFILREAGSIRQSDQGACFWEIPLTYGIFTMAQMVGIESGGGSNPRKRQDQREINPVDRPVVWVSSTSIVQKETFKKANGTDLILHTNGLPITQPFKYEDAHIIHTFAYNVDYASFDYSTYEPYVGKVNSSTVFGKNRGFYKCTSINCNEEYEYAGSGVSKTEFHYVRLALTFEYNPGNWIEEAKVVSMHTLQKITLLTPLITYYDGILINPTQFAQEPWPLDVFGIGIPYDNNNPANYGYIDHGYPKEANLATLAAIRSLSIP